MFRSKRIHDVPAARKAMEFASDAQDLRWAASLARTHGAREELVQELIELADRVKAEGKAARCRRSSGKLTRAGPSGRRDE